MSNRKWINTKEVESMFGIKPSTLARQRWGKYGLHDCCSIMKKPGSKRGLILYLIEKIENKLDALNKGNKNADRRTEVQIKYS